MAPPEETQDTTLELNPAHGGRAPHCLAAGLGGDVGAVSERPGAAVWATGWENGAGVSGTGLGDGTRVFHLDPDRDFEGVAGCRDRNPEEDPGGDSFHPGVPTRGRGESACGGDGDRCCRYRSDGGDGDHC